MDWRAQAACLTTDPEQFYPTATTGPAYDAQVREAKAVCAPCPVRAECLAEALSRIPYGIAGGLTEEERRTERLPRQAVDAVAKLKEEVRVGSRARVAAAGRELLAAGHLAADVAQLCGVSERTVNRWTARARSSAEPVAECGVA